MNEKCLLTVWDSQLKKNIIVEGTIINEVDGYCDEDFMRYDVTTQRGTFYGCHPNCIKTI